MLTLTWKLLTLRCCSLETFMRNVGMFPNDGPHEGYIKEMSRSKKTRVALRWDYKGGLRSQTASVSVRSWYALCDRSSVVASRLHCRRQHRNTIPTLAYSSVR